LEGGHPDTRVDVRTGRRALHLAAVEVAAEDVTEACRLAGAALGELAQIWYATGMDRVRENQRRPLSSICDLSVAVGVGPVRVAAH